MNNFKHITLIYLFILPINGFTSNYDVMKTLSKAVPLGAMPWVTQKIKGADLFVFPTQKCSARCPFCIGNRIGKYQNDRPADSIIKDINALVTLKIVSRIRFLGGEPFDYPALEYVLKNIRLKPRITTNGYAFIKNSGLRQSLNSLLDSIFISVHHYDEKKRRELMHHKGFSNEELFQAMQEVSIPTRMNTLLIKDFIDSPEEICKQILFARKAHFSEIAFKELTATDANMHDYVNADVVRFNHKHFVKVDNNMRTFKKKYKGAAPHVLFVAIRSKNPPFLALFNDGKIGPEWNPTNTLPDVDTLLAMQSKIKC